jgi:hypothetical protein
VADSIPVRTLLDVPVTFDVGDEQTHVPMVRANLGDIATKLILDTGSSDHVLTIELAEQARLTTEPAEPGTDSTGADVPSWSVGDLGVDIADASFALRDVVAVAGPAPFAGWGVGGFLSPQHLHPTGWTVLDLASDRLILLDGDEAEVAAWLARRSPSLRLLRLERVAGDPTIEVHASLEPFDAVITLLDSGGKSTEFVASAVPGVTGGSRGSSGRGVGGGEVFGSVVEGRSIVVGGTRLRVPKVVIRDSMVGHDGLVGMDVLRGTVLVVSADQERPVFWMVPISNPA